MTWPVAFVTLVGAFLVGAATGAIGVVVLVVLAATKTQRSSPPGVSNEAHEKPRVAAAGLN